MKIETFDDVLASIKKNQDRKLHLLLGNGFSMAYDRKIFSCNALHEFITKDIDLSTILGVIKSRNFEIIMQHLDTFSALIDAFDGSLELQKRIDAARSKLKKSLLRAIQELHPEHVFKVPKEQSETCSKFLKVFLNSGGNIYSTNYDLLLYWVLMRNKIAGHDDGCGRPKDKPKSELTWGNFRDKQNIFYLHGALPFFSNGVAIIKEECDQSNHLLENITARIKQNQYPVFITAGDGQQKLNHIRRNQYLTYCYDSLCKAKGSLVTFGFNFGPSDDHIIEAINKAANHGRKAPSKLQSLYIGTYSDEDKKHIKQIRGRFKCEVHIYNAKTAPVWEGKSS